jgi:predicted small secreted protein
MKWKGTILGIIIAIAALVLIFSRLNKRIKEKVAREEAAQKAAQQDMPVYTPPIDSFPYLYKPFDTVALTANSYVLLLKGSKADTDPQNKRTVEADGDMIFVIGKKDIPFSVNTRILQLKVLQPAVFRVEAFRVDNGEKVDVLEGVVRAAKRYKSSFPEPDTVRRFEMVMINDQIDLMEKEKEDLTEFAQWWQSRK